MIKKKIVIFAMSLVLMLGLAACGGTNAPVVTDRLDVQQLWKDATGQDGYPQASLVVKSDLASASGATVRAFMDAMAASDSWAQDNTEAAVEAVKNHMDEGAQSTMKTLSKEIVTRCNIAAVEAKDAKAGIETYLNGFLAMESEVETSLIGGKLPDSDFYHTPSDSAAPVETLNVFMPDGATALAMAKLMHDGGKIGGADVNYTVVTANTIASKLTTGAADIAIVPTNVAAKLYNANGKYKVIMTVTHGNLYIIGSDMENVQSLVGKRVGSIGQGAVPDLVLRYILRKNNVEYVFSDVAVEGKVALTYFADGGSVIKAIKGNLIDCGLLGEPAASMAFDAVHA